MRINHVTLLVKDKVVSEDFFTNKLGFKKHEIGSHLWIRIGEQFIHLTQNSGLSIADTFYHFAIEVPALDAYLRDITKRGVRTFDHREGSSFFVRDPDGNLIEFIEVGNGFFNPS